MSKIASLFLRTFEFQIEGVTLKARVLSIKDLASLQDKFSEWKTFEIGDLIAIDRFRAVSEICKLSLSGLNEGLTDDDIADIISVEDFEVWYPIWRKMIGAPKVVAEEGDSIEGEKSVPVAVT